MIDLRTAWYQLALHYELCMHRGVYCTCTSIVQPPIAIVALTHHRGRSNALSIDRAQWKAKAIELHAQLQSYSSKFERVKAQRDEAVRESSELTDKMKERMRCAACGGLGCIRYGFSYNLQEWQS